MTATKENKIIGIGSIVTIFDLDLEEAQVYKIVSAKTGKENEILFDAVVGKSLLGKTVGEKVFVKAEEEYQMEILSVDNSNVQAEKIYRNTFFCFQGKQFFHEYKGGYIFAGLNPSISHWNRLRTVKEGDIIFHGDMQGVLAISVAEGRCFVAKRPQEHYLANDKKDAEGLMVKTKYQLLKSPIITFEYTKEIIRLQGDHEGKGYPFNKNGKGNEGYLFNLNKSLAKFFMEEIIKCNSFMKEKDYVREILQ